MSWDEVERVGATYGFVGDLAAPERQWNRAAVSCIQRVLFDNCSAETLGGVSLRHHTIVPVMSRAVGDVEIGYSEKEGWHGEISLKCQLGPVDRSESSDRGAERSTDNATHDPDSQDRASDRT